jgi:hypothetical protein
VAAGRTAPAVGELFELDGQHPAARPEGHRLANVVLPVAGMRLVACAAGSAFLVLVHVQEVQVDVSIAEVRQGRRPGIAHDVAIVAVEAEGVAFLLERRVELGRVFLDEQPKELAAVDLVARSAVALGDGPVQARAGLDHPLDVPKLAAAGERDLTIVALEAQGHHLGLQDPRVVAGVRFVAVEARALGRHRRVLRGRRLHRVPDRLVAAQAERLRVLPEHHGVVGSVGLVAHLAVIRHRLVHDPQRVDLHLGVCMAGRAQLRAGREQEIRVRGCVCRVAGPAGPRGDRPVDVGHAVGDIVVALAAKLGHGVGHQELAVGPAVRVVACRAFTLDQRPVYDERLVNVHVVTERAQREAFAGEDVRVPLDALDLVARVAGVGAHRSVHGGVTQDVIVALPARLAAERAGGPLVRVEHRQPGLGARGQRGDGRADKGARDQDGQA